MTFSLRPFQDDFAEILPLLNLVNPDLTTVEQVREAVARLPADQWCRIVAVGAHGEIVGYANTTRWPGAQEGDRFLTLITRPEARQLGIGSALLAAGQEWARASGGKRLLSSATDDDEAYLQFGQRRGFQVTGHQILSALDLKSFDTSRFAGVVDAVLAHGVYFLTYADRPGEELQRQLYELYKVTDLDSPGYAGTDPSAYPPFEQWRAEIFVPSTLEDGIIIAAQGERLIGTTILQREKAGGIYTEYTGVLREYRGRQIGLALKLLSIQVANRYRAPHMTTKNDATNLPMLRVNQRMGYVKQSGRYWLVKAL